MKNPFKKEEVEVWHPASPGLKITVRRNWFQQHMRPKKFATLKESIKANKRIRKKKKDENSI